MTKSEKRKENLKNKIMSEYKIQEGTVQMHLVRMEPFVFRSFGLPQYDKEVRILPLNKLIIANLIVKRLNDGDITEDKAIEFLNLL